MINRTALFPFYIETKPYFPETTANAYLRPFGSLYYLKFMSSVLGGYRNTFAHILAGSITLMQSCD